MNLLNLVPRIIESKPITSPRGWDNVHVSFTHAESELDHAKYIKPSVMAIEDHISKLAQAKATARLYADHDTALQTTRADEDYPLPTGWIGPIKVEHDIPQFALVSIDGIIYCQMGFHKQLLLDRPLETDLRRDYFIGWTQVPEPRFDANFATLTIGNAPLPAVGVGAIGKIVDNRRHITTFDGRLNTHRTTIDCFVKFDFHFHAIHAGELTNA